MNLTKFWIYGLLCSSFSPLSLMAQDYAVQFIDDNNQPIQFAVAVNPSVAISTKNVNSTPAVMDQINKQFSPMVIAVEQGQNVAFPNSDNIRHHVYSFSKAKRFETKLYANKPEAPILFDQPGLVVLGCNIHDKMIGYIFVSSWQDFAVSNQQGIATIQTKVAPTSIEFWHPWSQDPNKVYAYTVKQWPTDEPLIIQLSINRPAEEISPKKKGFGNRW